MYPKLQAMLPYLDSQLSSDEVESFKIGITNDVGDREDGYPGFHLFLIARSDDSQKIIAAEKDLIIYYINHKILSDKCLNIQTGGGQVNDATRLYVAIKCRAQDPLYYLIAFVDLNTVVL